MKMPKRNRAYIIPRTLWIILLGLALFYLIQNYAYKRHTSLTQQVATSAADQSVSFSDQVKPLLDKRCVVCHSCYDAPCQLKLSSVQGVARGANIDKVYNPKRLTAASPTRLFIDAKTTSEWRDQNFHSVIDRPLSDNASDTRPLLQMLLDLKGLHPQPEQGRLPADFTLVIDREQTCPTADSIGKYIDQNPLWGMPYAMPNLSPQESRVLTTWLESGAAMVEPALPINHASLQVRKWEAFFNQTSNKQKLVSRYIYEHLFHAHIHFGGSPNNEFY